MIRGYLFDASSIINLIKRGYVKFFSNGYTLDLALYESLNAIWKEYSLIGKLSYDDAILFTNILGDIFRNRIIGILTIDDLEEEIFRFAIKEKLTIYDSSYLILAIKNNLVLVTDDKQLKAKSSRYVETITTQDVINRFL